MGGPNDDHKNGRGFSLSIIDLKHPRDSLATAATLVRLPNLFTAPPDVVVGAALATGAGYSIAGTAIERTLTISGLMIASMLLYAAGTSLNDYFDADEDIRERPERPIPSGDISPTAALMAGIGFLIGGIGVAVVAAGGIAGAVAGSLALIILLYDGVLKGTIGGFLCMGGARAVNILLGTTAAISPLALPPWAFAIPVVVLVYIASVTSMAERETSGNSDDDRDDREAVMVGIGGVVVAVLGVLGLLSVRLSSLSLVELATALILFAAFLVWTGRPLRAAYADPAPWTIGSAVGACIVGLIALDAAIAATSGIGWGLAAIVFAIPAVGLSRAFAVT